MLSLKLAPDDQTKKAWLEHFQAINSIEVLTINPSGQESWSNSKKQYQVGLEVTLLPSAKNAPIPDYGWGKNPNLRWLTIEKNQNSSWQVAEIATGP